MNKTNPNAAILSISLSKSSDISLQSQLAQAIRALVHEGKLRSGDKLPSSRSFAQELSVSRVTITAVLDQLVSEGYLEGRRGSGVFVSTDLPDIPIAATRKPQASAFEPRPPRHVRPFDTASPDLGEFPHREWAKLFELVWRRPVDDLLNGVHALGWGPLRVAISEHLRDWRGIHCDPSQIVVTSGLAEALELICQAVLESGDHILMEEPGHQVIRRVLKAIGLNCHSARVDDQGFNPDAIQRGPRQYRAAILTPSRHFPLGMTLPLARRLQMLNWADNEDAYVIEDDFDGEFRFHGQPLPAMMNLDKRGRVIYVGSFSKVMFPGLRLGFMVLPPALVAPVSEALALTGPKAALIAQPVLARFMSGGGFATHIRRMRRLYAERQKAVVAAVRDHADGILEVDPESGGMHLVARLGTQIATRVSDVEAARRAASAGISARALSEFFAGPADQQGLVLGYSAFPADVLETAVKRLSDTIARP
ncbi:MAG: PLP-dependent aminotransferase family protein [Proteobacteria bacterium]|nr:PLP-dependent aminotransferase family protein [Pseudomonadota bacterium]MDA1294023.1 PLP-dependent aminotransferase family protein [Pseudomonadota bacterium]